MRGRIGARCGMGTAVCLAGAALALPGAAQAAGRDTYIVQLRAKPLASYQGGTKGMAATSPRSTGRPLDTRSSTTRAYRTFLAGRQTAALGRLDRSVKLRYSYRSAFAGFSAELSAKEAARLRKAPEVARVRKDRLWKPMVDPGAPIGPAAGGDGAAYLRLTDTDPTIGLWTKLGGPTSAAGAGAGEIVGVIDTGIEPASPSFDDGVDGTNYIGDPFPAPTGWNGDCETGPGFTAADCNNKLIGARYYVDGFGVTNLAADSHLSPYDDDGHGSHTTSTAAGNYGVDPVIQGTGGAPDNDLGVDLISGISPRSQVAMYKICWEGNQTTSPSGCTNSDSVAAIDDAINDGVDVINYSIGSSDSAVYGFVEDAFLGASDAGVFVANSAGNDGPSAGTVGSPAAVPWLTAVGASTMARTFTATAQLDGPGSDVAHDFDIVGESITPALSTPTDVVDAADSALAPATADDSELCQPDSLDPAKVTGKVVLCLRGGNDRIEKSKVVQDAGGVGMILYNPNDGQDRETDTHWVPTVHVSKADGLKVKADIAAGTTTATLTQGAKRALPDAALPDEAPRVQAAFSSRGPQSAVPDIAKPDITAPGVNILAAASEDPSVTTKLQPGQLFQSISGTSMASPHVAGAAALLRQAHPLFSPAAIKSTLMTTANPATKKEDGSPGDPFDAGSGEIDPNQAVDAGLVVDAGTGDYLSYLATVAPLPGESPGVAPKDLNLPSISISQLAGTDQTSRRFTSVDDTAQSWSVTVEQPAGVVVTPDETSFTIRPGRQQDVGVAFRVTTAALDEYAFGALVLTNDDDGRTVRVPISLKPVAVAAPEAVKISTAQAAGSRALSVKTGYAGTLRALGWGVAAPVVRAGQTVMSSPDGGPDPAGSPSTKVYTVDVPAGSQLFSARISNADGGDPNTDLDLYVYRDQNGNGTFEGGELVAQSASGIADEEVTSVIPAGGKYGVAVTGFTTKSPSVYDLTTWVDNDASPDDPSNEPGLQVLGEPAASTIGGIAPLSVNWKGVNAKGLYLGVITYHHDTSSAPGSADALSLVELTKTTSTGGPGTPGPGTPGPGTPGPGTPGPGTPGPGTPGATKLSLKLRGAKLVKRNKVLRARLTVSKRASVRATVKAGTKTKARSATKQVTGAGKTVRVDLRLNKRLRVGDYRVTVVAGSGKERSTKTITLRVRP